VRRKERHEGKGLKQSVHEERGERGKAMAKANTKEPGVFEGPWGRGGNLAENSPFPSRQPKSEGRNGSYSRVEGSSKGEEKRKGEKGKTGETEGRGEGTGRGGSRSGGEGEIGQGKCLYI